VGYNHLNMKINGATGTPNYQIARAAGTVMGAIILSQLVGLGRNIVITWAFGTSAGYDAFVGASRITDLLFNLVAGGALASAFVPTFTGFLTHEDRAGAWRLASGVINLLFIVLVLISGLAAVFAPQLVRNVLFVLDRNFDPKQVQLTASLLRIMLPAVIIFGISGLVMGILNSHQVFWIPAVAPAMWSIGQIFGILFLPAGWGISRLAWGYVIGSLLHLVVQIPTLLRLAQRRFSLSLGLDNPAVREVIRLMGPRLLGVAVVQVNFIVNTIIAFSLPVGSVGGLNYAFGLMMMPEMAIAQAIAIAALPTFSAQVAMGRLEEMRASLAATLRGVLLLALPASLGLILLRQPLVALIYQRGTFTSESTVLVSSALLWYAAGLVGHSMVEVVVRAFFALHDTRTPVIVGVAAMSLNVGFSLAFTALFSRVGWIPLGGLALANSLATFLEMTGLLVLMRRRLKGLEGRSLLAGLGQATLAGVGMGLLLGGWTLVAGHLRLAVYAVGGIVLGGGGYAAILWLLRVPETRQVMRVARRQVARITSKAAGPKG